MFMFSSRTRFEPRTPEPNTEFSSCSASRPNRTPGSERRSNAERRSCTEAHPRAFYFIFMQLFTIYRHLYNILAICNNVFVFIQLYHYSSIDSHGLMAVSFSWEVLEDPSTQTKTDIFRIFPF